MASTQPSTSILPANGADAAISGRHLTILYMTQSGTSSDLAQRISREARRKRFTVNLYDSASYDPADLVSEDLVLFLVSTTGQGEFPTSARPFWNFLLRKGIPEDILGDLHFAAFGLGDTTYPRFCWPVRLLSRRLKGLGAQEMVDHGEGDEMHYLGLEGELGPWLDKFWSKMDELLPLGEGVAEIGRDEILPPSAVVRRSEDLEEENKVEVQGLEKHLTGEAQGWTRSKLNRNERMTAADHFQDVRLLEFVEFRPPNTTGTSAHSQLNGHDVPSKDRITWSTYQPGDVLCLHPRNNPAAVTEILSRLDLSSATVVTVSGPTVPSTVPQSPLTLRTLFTNHLDFTAVPTRSFFDQIRLFSPPGSLEREKLDEYCGIYPAEELAKGANPQDGIDEMFEYAQRPRRTIKEVLAEFKSVSIPLEHVADVFPFMKPREFSIASAPPSSSAKKVGEEKKEQEKHAIQLSVAIVKYKTRLRKARTGLCTRWLSTLKSGDEVAVLLKPGYLTLPAPNNPLILIGPGTGCAPLRSLVFNRLSSSAVSPEIHLFLGFRNRSKDYLFSEDWQSLAETHKDRFHLHTAFSRDGEGKVYVQDLIKKDEISQVLWNAIVQKNACIVVAGASGKMPEQVRAAFEDMAMKWGGMDEDQARRFLDSLERQRRWQEECWS
ncbi:related to NADPH-dependent FMN and FAD containing oxidoreductase (NR1) [Melanopsichium pennsylvanicum]|uniref:NADPH-dependent diflavin oxidoreductase 1 n=2 Tax=Melanopsichium pennsylvanicum TaxID=63383 RepID=A0AAJ4XU38_9BASI|nr:related to NADPH-dependent FMN and FAD containing oxidoreductase (NR1) [Melanopsichium pennsylvanicum 4]SNX87458.1 related to NADPH-dependent FMN and FAD containing oxidoreductase (NR1) [Melanopsichium pennsylvanicum]